MRSRRLIYFSAFLAIAALCWVGFLGVATAKSDTPEDFTTYNSKNWTPIFANDFSTGKLASSCTPGDRRPEGQTGTYLRPDEVQISGGMLRLSIRRRDYGGLPFTGGGIECHGFSQLYGRYEYRAMVAPVAGIDSYVILMPESGKREDATFINIFTAARQPLRPMKVNIRNGFGDGISKEIVDRSIDGFHDYRIEWDPSGLRIMVDKAVVFADEKASGKYRWFGFGVGTGEEETGLPEPDVSPAEFLIDWLRIYKYKPGDLSSAPPIPQTLPGTASGKRPRRVALRRFPR